MQKLYSFFVKIVFINLKFLLKLKAFKNIQFGFGVRVGRGGGTGVDGP